MLSRSAGPVSAAGPRALETGLTLVELLIALALLGFVLLGIAPLFLASVKSNYSANEYTSVNVLARDKLEELENLPVNAPDLAEGSHPSSPGPNGDLPGFLPDPKTGVPPLAGTPGVVNPYKRTWLVTSFHLPQTSTVPASNPFVSAPVPGAAFDYKQIDVTVETDVGHLGIGSRRSRISGFVQNPNFLTPPPTGTPVPPTPTP